MGSHGKRAATLTLGLLSAVGLALIWVFLLAPVRWDLRYPGGASSGFLTILSCFVMSIVAGRWGGRRWHVLTAIAVLTFLYMGFFVRSPYWN
jgi:fucose 4-O-acetylase-like acetyltransferase